jgi:hypothetical protein
VLVSIFVTQVFALAKSEFSAVFGLGLYLLPWGNAALCGRAGAQGWR